MPPDFDRRSRKYLIFRLLIILTGVGLVSFYQLSLGSLFGQNTFRYLYILLGIYLTLGLILLASYSRWRQRPQFLRWQVTVDFLFQAMLIWGTGGVLSIFSPLLFVTVVAATSVITARDSFILATVATLFLTVTTVASTLGIQPVSPPAQVGTLPAGKSSLFIVSYLLGSIFALYTICALGSKFSHGLRSIQGLQSEILENMAEGLIAVDEGGTVVQLNREARKLLGVPEPHQGRRGLKLDSLFPLPEHQCLRRAFEQPQRRRLTTTIVAAEGRERPVEVKISSVSGDVGGARYRIGLISDLTLKREIEAAERRIQKLEDLHVMALGIAHEIRNPLASIRGCVQEIGRLCRGLPQVSAYMEIVCRESDRLDNTLEEFLRYARSGPVDLAPIDLAQVIDEAVLLLRSRPDIASRRIVWSTPPCRPRVFGDRNSLVQVFLNLGINALEATSSEGGVIAVGIRPGLFPALPADAGDRDLVPGVEIEVRDNGRGLRRADSRMLFTPFFTTKSRGTGLGLCIVERIVRDHMGVVDFSSEEGKGTSFRVWLPVIAEAQPETTFARTEEAAIREETAQVCHA